MSHPSTSTSQVMLVLPDKKEMPLGALVFVHQVTADRFRAAGEIGAAIIDRALDERGRERQEEDAEQ